MGSLSSRPNVPAPRSQVVFTPQPTASPTPAPSTSTDAGRDAGGARGENHTPSASRARTSSLLGRDRGRFGTVLTGFKGFLGLSDLSNARKSLLGE